MLRAISNLTHPLHKTIYPGGGSQLLAKYPPSEANALIVFLIGGALDGMRLYRGLILQMSFHSKGSKKFEEFALGVDRLTRVRKNNLKATSNFNVI